VQHDEGILMGKECWCDCQWTPMFTQIN